MPDQSYDIAHTLARKGTPNLYLAANFLEPEEKFRAFLASYAAMRLVDDLADDSRAQGDISPREQKRLASKIDDFAQMFESGRLDFSLPYSGELHAAIARFRIPTWPFTLLAESMKFDLVNDRFDTFEQFLWYSEGAAVAPAAIFMHLAGCSYSNEGRVHLPKFDIREAARPLAIFSYLVHILRDFKKDFKAGAQPLIYIDLGTTEMFFVSTQEMAETVATEKQSLKFTKMIMWLFNRLTAFQVEAEASLHALKPQLPDDGRFTLRFIYELYGAIARKISRHGYIIVREEIDLRSEDITKAAEAAARWAGTSSDAVLPKLTSLLQPQE